MPKPSNIPRCPAPPALRSSSLAVQDYRISLITPLFGGGVEAGHADPHLPIRGSSIRGQLQFWWRATRGIAFSRRDDLFAAHCDIWGTINRRSKVDIEVRDVDAQPATAADWKALSTGQLAYALFPFQSQNGPTFLKAASFTLRLRFPDNRRQDIDAALRGWLNFGGLGARTRRGCGALFCDALAPQNPGDLKHWLGTTIDRRGSETLQWPTLSDELLTGTPSTDPTDTWRRLIGLLQSFRQGKGFARNPGGDRPGRSRYPEPETIRRVARCHAPAHGRLADIPDDAFPRAELGLPIVFHFKDKGDPATTVLYPDGANGAGRDRMASPLILKPLALRDRRILPVILRLSTPALSGVELKRSGQDGTALSLPPTTTVRHPRLADYRNSPLAASPAGSTIEAFLAYARTDGFG